MTKEEHINYWIEIAEEDYKTMLNLLKSEDNHWALFMGHLVIEKLLKALYVKNKDNNIPKIHDLSRLWFLCDIELTEEKENILDLITQFNINVRYPDYKKAFYKKCTKEFTLDSISKIEEIRKWIKKMLKKQ